MQPKPDTLDPVAGPKSLILGGHDFHSITEIVSGRSRGRRRSAGGRCSRSALALLGGLAIGVPWLFWEGIGVWGLNIPVGWAWDITNFVFWVGIGHAGTLISAILLPVPAEVAHLDQPLGRGDDDLRGDVRADLPGHPRRPRLGRLLDVPAPEPDGHVAELPQPAAVGRLRGQHLRHGLAAVLVRRPDPRPGDACATARRPGCKQLDLRRLRARLARLATGTGSTTRSPT